MSVTSGSSENFPGREILPTEAYYQVTQASLGGLRSLKSSNRLLPRLQLHSSSLSEAFLRISKQFLSVANLLDVHLCDINSNASQLFLRYDWNERGC